MTFSDWYIWLEATIQYLKRDGGDLKRNYADVKMDIQMATARVQRITLGRSLPLDTSQHIRDDKLERYLFGGGISLVRRGNLLALLDRMRNGIPRDSYGIDLSTVMRMDRWCQRYTDRTWDFPEDLWTTYSKVLFNVCPDYQSAGKVRGDSFTDSIDAFFRVADDAVNSEEGLLILCRLLWKSLSVVRLQMCVVPRSRRTGDGIYGFYTPWPLAVALEDLRLSVTKNWIGSKASRRPYGMPHDIPFGWGWTIDPARPGRFREVWPTQTYNWMPYVRDVPIMCHGSQSHWSYNPLRDNGVACVSCKTNPAGLRFRPCGHKVVCICCFTDWLDDDDRRPFIACPVCESDVRDAVRDSNHAELVPGEIGTRNGRKRVPDRDTTLSR